jgi:hypothetical protein
MSLNSWKSSLKKTKKHKYNMKFLLRFGCYIIIIYFKKKFCQHFTVLHGNYCSSVMWKQGGWLREVSSWAMASEYFPFDHQNLFWYGCQLPWPKKSLCMEYVRFALISGLGASQVVVLLWLWILETGLGKRIVIKMKTLFQCFFSNFVMLPHWWWSTRRFSQIWL